MYGKKEINRFRISLKGFPIVCKYMQILAPSKILCNLTTIEA